jgi:alkanesulfonate monooxygenase SsuD/methylene tetrahydromethanopterin reductase-like flavin-dependent oxidoreductase (luciferase family)
MHLRMLSGEPGPVPCLDKALSYPYTAVERQKIQEAMSAAVVGTPEQVKTRLDRIAALHAVDEVVVLTICHDPDARRHSYELLAEVFELPR